MADLDDVDWMPVIGRSLAYLCLTAAEMRDEPMLAQARFLEGLGLERREVAKMLGTSVDSIGAQARQARNKRGKGGNSKKSKKRR